MTAVIRNKGCCDFRIYLQQSRKHKGGASEGQKKLRGALDRPEAEHITEQRLPKAALLPQHVKKARSSVLPVAGRKSSGGSQLSTCGTLKQKSQRDHTLEIVQQLQSKVENLDERNVASSYRPSWIKSKETNVKHRRLSSLFEIPTHHWREYQPSQRHLGNPLMNYTHISVPCKFKSPEITPQSD
jgi:hypothetical protein